MKVEEVKYRTEISGRSKYFHTVDKALKHFEKCIAKKIDSEVWEVRFKENFKTNKIDAIQKLLHYISFCKN